MASTRCLRDLVFFALASSSRCAGRALFLAAAVSCASSVRHTSDGGVSSTANTDVPLLAQATAELTEIRPRKTIDPGEVISTDLTTSTAWWPITAKATFRTTPEGDVDLALHAVECRTAYSYPVRIYATSDCSEIKRDSPAWDGVRGVLKSKAICMGGPGARLYEARSNAKSTRWSLGGAAASNLVGRTIAIHDPDTLEPLACGTIEAAGGGAPPSAAPNQVPRNAVVAQLAGLCALGPIRMPAAGAEPGCPDLDKVSACALTHCVSDCLDTCAEYTGCLDASTEGCGSPCRPDEACRLCLSSAGQCMVLGFCRDTISCAPPPTPGGPCTELRECCMRQGPLVEGCLSYVELLERLSGDPSCIGALSDVDFNGAFAFRSPCFPDGGVPAE